MIHPAARLIPLALGLAAVLAGCDAPPVGVKLAEASGQSRMIQGIGYVEPAGEVRRLAFKHPGVIARVMAEVGEQVVAGSTLALLHDETEQAMLALALARLEVAEAERKVVEAGTHPELIDAARAALAAAEADAAEAVRESDRQQRLRDERVNSKAEEERSKSLRAAAEARVRESRHSIRAMENSARETDMALAGARVVEAEQAVRLAQARLNEMRLVAPFDGTVLEILRREGEAAHSAWPETVVVFGDASRVVVRAEFDEDHALALREAARWNPGLSCTIFGQGLGSLELEGIIKLVKPVMGDRTVFARTASERKDLDVIQAIIELSGGDEVMNLPVGLELNVRLQLPVNLKAHDK